MVRFSLGDIRRERIKLGVAVVLTVVACGMVWHRFLNRSPAVEAASRRLFMCSQTQKTFWHTIQAGEIEPILSPHSGEHTGYIPERCYWTQDGKAKLEPTYVILNTKLDPTAREKTLCPDCGRSVQGRNPPPPPVLMAAARGDAG